MPVEELIKKLQSLPPNTKVLMWKEHLDGYYAIQLSDLDEATQYDDQYLRAKVERSSLWRCFEERIMPIYEYVCEAIAKSTNKENNVSAHKGQNQ